MLAFTVQSCRAVVVHCALAGSVSVCAWVTLELDELDEVKAPDNTRLKLDANANANADIYEFRITHTNTSRNVSRKTRDTRYAHPAYAYLAHIAYMHIYSHCRALRNVSPGPNAPFLSVS